MDIQINALFVIVALLVLGAGIRGFSNGFTRTTNSLIGTVLGLISIVIFALTVNSYLSERYSKVFIGVICLIIALLVHRIVDFILTSLKVITKLPVIKAFDKLLGFALGISEGIVIFWILGIVIVAYGAFGFEELIQQQIAENEILTFLFNNNIVALLLSKISM